MKGWHLGREILLPPDFSTTPGHFTRYSARHCSFLSTTPFSLSHHATDSDLSQTASFDARWRLPVALTPNYYSLIEEAPPSGLSVQGKLCAILISHLPRRIQLDVWRPPCHGSHKINMPKRKASEMEVAYGFYVECPTKPTTGPRKGVTDLYDEKDTPEMPELRIDFTISPGSEWNKMRKYRNVKCECLATCALL